MNAYKKCCRLCLTSGNASVPIFKTKTGKESYAQQIGEVFRIELLVNDDWPSKACKDCVRLLDELRDLRAKVRTAQQTLVQAAEECALKLEPRVQLTVDDLPEVLPPLPIERIDLKPPVGVRFSSRTRKKAAQPQLPEPDISTENISEDEAVEVAEVPLPPKRTRKPRLDITIRRFSSSESETEPTPRNDYQDKDFTVAGSDPEEELLSEEEYLDEMAYPSLGDTPDKPRVKRIPKEPEEDAPELEDKMRQMGLLNCHICREKHEGFDDMCRHIYAVHKKRGYIYCCGRMIVRACARDHMRYHLNKQAFMCDSCGRELKSSYELKDHQKRHKEKGFSCDSCGKVLMSANSYNKHILTHLPGKTWKHECPTCKKGFKSQKNFGKHVCKPPVKNDEEIWMCEICGKVLSSKARLKQHGAVHQTRTSKPCDICGKHVFNVQDHKRRIHRDMKKIPCEICGKEYTKLGLKTHKKLYHSNHQWLKCQVCEKEFRRRNDLICHMNIHSGVTFQCFFCSFSTSQKTNRIHHMKASHPTEYAEHRAKKFTEVRVKEVAGL